MRLKNLTLLTCLLFWSTSFVTAQKSSYIGIETALTASDIHIFNSVQNDREITQILFDRSQPKLNWNFATTYERELKENVFFKMGMEIASHGYIGSEFRVFGLNGSGVTTISERLNVLYLGIPVSIRFEKPISKIAPFVELGLAPSIAAFNNSVGVNRQTFERERSFVPLFNRFALATNLAIGSNYALNEKHTLYAQLHSQLMLTDLYRENEKHTSFYSLGLRAGVRMAI